MRPDDMRQLLRVQPFRPFRFYVHETTVYEIRHPDQAAVGRSTMTISVHTSGSLSLLGDQEVLIALLHITRVDFLPRPASSNGG